MFFPTSASTLHDTGVDSKYISTHECLSGYKGLYCCMFGNCDYSAQVRANTQSYIRRVHLGHAIGCRYCPTWAWWQVCTWLDHMSNTHPKVPKYPHRKCPGYLSKLQGEILRSSSRKNTLKLRSQQVLTSHPPKRLRRSRTSHQNKVSLITPLFYGFEPCNLLETPNKESSFHF